MVHHRRTARIIPVSPRGHVLLLHGHDPDRPGSPYWFSIGGGIEPGETPQEAAARKLWEEAGIRVDPMTLGDPFHVGSHRYRYAGGDYVSRSIFFARRLPECPARPAALQPGEVITTAKWWPSESVGGLPLSNREIPEIVRLAVAKVRRG